MPALRIALAVAGCLLLTASTVAAAPPDPFRGAYVSVDPADDSNQRLSLGGGGSTRMVTLFDDLATGACDPAAPVTLRGVGTVNQAGGELEVELSGTCAGGEPSGPFTVTFTDNGNGTLSDNASGAEWHRPGG